MGWGVPEAWQQCCNSSMNFDLTVPQEEQEITRLFILGRTLSSGPTINSHIGVKCNTHIDIIIVLKMYANIKKLKKKPGAIIWKKGKWKRMQIFVDEPKPQTPRTSAAVRIRNVSAKIYILHFIHNRLNIYLNRIWKRFWSAMIDFRYLKKTSLLKIKGKSLHEPGVLW